MVKIMFVCHGNICRSPMAEFIFKDIIKKSNCSDKFVVASSATSTEEICNGHGNPVYPPAKKILSEHGIDCSGKHAVQLKKSDYEKYDLFLCMDSNNVRNALRIFGGDKDKKVIKLMSLTGSNADVSDPWYSGDFTTAYNDIYLGCTVLAEKYGGTKMSEIKICVFADYHYWPERSPYTFEGMLGIIDRAKENGADVLIECGDFTPDGTHTKDFIDAYLHNKYNIPAMFCYGNHELEKVDSLQTLNKLFETDNSYYYRDINGFRIIALDSNHWYDDDGTFLHYPGNYWGSPKGYAYDQNVYGKEQMEWLKNAVESTELPCLFFAHAPIHKTSFPEHKELMHYFAEINKKTPGKILMFFSGHQHRNNIEAIDGVVHFNVNSANNGEWMPTEHNLFPKEYCERYPGVTHNADFETPLSAIVTVNSNGHVVIEGSETTYKFGVTPEMIGGPLKSPYGVAMPRIDSKEFNLF